MVMAILEIGVVYTLFSALLSLLGNDDFFRVRGRPLAAADLRLVAMMVASKTGNGDVSHLKLLLSRGQFLLRDLQFGLGGGQLLAENLQLLL